MLLVDDLAAGGTKNLRHTPRGLVTLYIYFEENKQTKKHIGNAWIQTTTVSWAVELQEIVLLV